MCRLFILILTIIFFSFQLQAQITNPEELKGRVKSLEEFDSTSKKHSMRMLFDKDGNLLEKLTSYGSLEFHQYNKSGDLTKSIFKYDSTLTTPQIVYEYEQLYNSHRKLIEKRSFQNGKLLNFIKFSYQDSGKYHIEFANYFNLDSTSTGFTITKLKNGKWMETKVYSKCSILSDYYRNTYNKKGLLIECYYSEFITKYKYDNHGRVIEENSIDPLFKPNISKRNFYNKKGQLFQTDIYAGDSLYSKIIMANDDHGTLIKREVETYNVKVNWTPFSYQSVPYYYEYDKKGNWIKCKEKVGDKIKTTLRRIEYY